MKNSTKKNSVFRIFLLVLCFSLVFSLISCDKSKKGKLTIGILQYAEHSSLDNCREGFLQGLKENGLKEGEDYTLLNQNAGADDSLNQQIAQNFCSRNVDLMCAIATPAAIACFAATEDKNIPVIFTAVTDPEKAGLTKGNITGTSDKLPVEEQLKLIRALQPEAKKIGIIYTLSEPNSVSAIERYNELSKNYGFIIEAKGVAAQADIPLAVDSLISKKVDCFSNLTDNNVVDVLDSVLEKTDAAKIPVYGSEVEQVKKGCVACAGIDYFKLGVQTAALAAKVLKGEAKCENLPYETIEENELFVNSDALDLFGIKVPDELSSKMLEAKDY